MVGRHQESSRLSRLCAVRRDGATYQIWFRLPVPNPNPNPNLNPNLTLKVTIMYAVQNDTEIKFNIVLYVKVIFVGQGVGIQKAYTANDLRYDG